MKKLWARVGMTFEVSDEDYKTISDAIKNNDCNTVSDILFKSNYYTDGDGYLPEGIDDNPNGEDFDF